MDLKISQKLILSIQVIQEVVKKQSLLRDERGGRGAPVPEHPLRSLRRGLERVRGGVHADAREQVVQKQPAAVRIRGQIRGSRRRRTPWTTRR